MLLKESNDLIDALGGTTATAKKCDVIRQTVHSWRINGLPKPWEMFLRCAYPEAFDD